MNAPDKYDVILADPPWQFRVWDKDTGQGRSAEAHYSTMTIDDICALPIRNLAANNSALFLWAVWPSLFEYVPSVLDAWGFEYKTIAWVWIKANQSGFGFFTGMGYYTRANSEPCLLAVRGSMPVADRSIQSLLYSAIRKHSQKPDDQYRKIEALYPGKRYLELFARRKREGWDSWGNEIESDIEMNEINEGAK